MTIHATLSELRIDEATWAAGSTARRNEWLVAIAEVVQEGRFESTAAAVHTALLTIGPPGRDRATLEVRDQATHDLPMRELRPLMDEYMQICGEMGKLSQGANSPRLEALDIAKRITHDEAAELVRNTMRSLKPDHGTARRLFTLLVTLFFDTTRLAAPAHLRP